MAGEEILQGIAQDLSEANEAVETAEVLISAMKEAGEETAELETQLRSLKMRKSKWEKMLKGRGFTPV